MLRDRVRTFWREGLQTRIEKAPPWKTVRFKYSGKLARILKVVGLVLGCIIFTPYALTPAYLLVNPPLSTFMVGDLLTGQGIRNSWRNLEDISPNLARQVIISEDAQFCRHWGVDWDAIDDALEASDQGRPRGASTITMQTAKNLFLWNKPAYLRKVLELPLSYYMDFVLGKRRILEIYLNVAEWGPGIYGAEAAARYHFRKRASEITVQEAAQLAAALPNPKRRSAGRPAPGTFALANRLRLRAVRERAAAACVVRSFSWETNTTISQ